MEATCRGAEDLAGLAVGWLAAKALVWTRFHSRGHLPGPLGQGSAGPVGTQGWGGAGKSHEDPRGHALLW